MTGISKAKNASLKVLQTLLDHSFTVVVWTESNFFTRAIMTMVKIKLRLIKSPGTIPAKNKLPIDTFAVAPKTIIAIEGGMILPSSPDVPQVAAAIFFG